MISIFTETMIPPPISHLPFVVSLPLIMALWGWGGDIGGGQMKVRHHPDGFPLGVYFKSSGEHPYSFHIQAPLSWLTFLLKIYMVFHELRIEIIEIEI